MGKMKKTLAIILSMLMAVQTPAMAGELVAEEAPAVEEFPAEEEGVIEEELPEEVMLEDRLPEEVAEEELQAGELLEEATDYTFEEELAEEPIEAITEELPAEQINTGSSEEEGNIEEDDPTAEETEGETEDEVSEEASEENPEAAGDPAATVTMSSPELAAPVVLKSGREIPFTIAFDKADEETAWKDAAFTVTATDKDGNSIPVTEDTAYTNAYILKPSKDLPGTDFTVSVQMTIKGAEGEEDKTATAEIKGTGSNYTAADFSKVSVTGLEGSYYFFPGNAYSFTATGSGPEDKDAKVGDTRWAPYSFLFEGESSATSFNNSKGDLMKTGNASSTKGITTAKSNKFDVTFHEFEWDGTAWTDLGIEQVKSVTVKSLAIPEAEKYAKVAEIGESKTYTFKMAQIPETVKVKTEGKGHVTASIKKGSPDSSGLTEYSVSFTGESVGSEKIYVYFTQNGKDINIKYYTVNVYQQIYLAEGESITDTLDVAADQELDVVVDYRYCTPKDAIKVTADKGVATFTGTTRLSKGFVRVLIMNKATSKIVNMYHVYVVQGTTVTIEEGKETNFNFTRSTRPNPDPVATSEDSTIATAVANVSGSYTAGYNINLKITGKKEGKTVVNYFENGALKYRINVNVNGRIGFSDVTNPDDFFYDPIYWAVDNGITTGYNDNTFRPYNNCNRAAVVTFLWKLAGKPDMGITNAFSDMTGNNYFDHAITWAAAKGIATGYNDGTFRPWDTCHRAAIVTFLWRYAGKPKPKSIAKFKDMTGNDDFNKAISWASEKGITTGYTDGTFRPYKKCLRLAVATFLYRYAHL